MSQVDFIKLADTHNFFDVIVLLNDWSYGVLGAGVAIGVAAIVFIISKYYNNETQDCLMVSTFVGSILSALFIVAAAFSPVVSGIPFLQASIPIVLMVICVLLVVVKFIREGMRW